MIDSVKRLCRDEYGLEVEGRIIGNTLGVVIPIEGLVGEDLKLDTDAADKIEDLALSMRRVILSTDRNIDFYVLCARDTKMVGAEYVMTGYVMDIKRVILRDISRGQYLSRLQKDFRLSPSILGEHKIKKLFDDLNKGVPPDEALSDCARFALTEDTVQTVFYPVILIAEPGSVRYEIIDMTHKEVSEGEALFWLKVKERYRAAAGSRKGASIFPSGFTNEYLILVNRGDQSKPFTEIMPKYFADGDTIQQRYMERIYERYEDSSVVGSDGLPCEDIKLTGFLADQIARRLKSRLENEMPFKDTLKVSFVKGDFSEGCFKVDFGIQGEEEAAFTEALIMVRDITREYWFEDFDGAEISSQTSGRRIFLGREDLRATGKRKIDAGEYLSFD